MSLHIPKIYERWATPVQVNLGSTAQTVDEIAVAVKQLALDGKALAQVPAAVNAVSLQVANVQAAASDVKAGLTDARIDFNNFAGAAQAQLRAAADDIVKRVLDGQQTDVGGLLNEKSAPLVRVLTQAQAVALDATPAEKHTGNGKYKGWLKNDVALDELLHASVDEQRLLAGHAALLARFQQAFAPFGSTALPDRARRYAEIDHLAHDIVDSLK